MLHVDLPAVDRSPASHQSLLDAVPIERVRSRRGQRDHSLAAGIASLSRRRACTARRALAGCGIEAMARGVEDIARCPIPSAPGWRNGHDPTGCASRACACRSVSSASFTEPAQRDLRRGCAVPQVRQRSHPARRLERAFEPRDSCLPGRGAGRRGSARRLHPARAHHRSGRSRVHAVVDDGIHRRGGAAWRQEPGDASPAGSPRAGHRTPRRRLPRVRGSGCRPRHGTQHRQEFQAAAHGRVRGRGNSTGRCGLCPEPPRAGGARTARRRLRSPRRRRRAEGRCAREARHRSGLVHRIPRRHHRGTSGRRCRRRH